MLLNLAEGQKFQNGNRRKHYEIAHGSANEVKAALDVAEAWGWIENRGPERELLDRVLALLWSSLARSRSPRRLRGTARELEPPCPRGHKPRPMGPPRRRCPIPQTETSQRARPDNVMTPCTGDLISPGIVYTMSRRSREGPDCHSGRPRVRIPPPLGRARSASAPRRRERRRDSLRRARRADGRRRTPRPACAMRRARDRSVASRGHSPR